MSSLEEETKDRLYQLAKILNAEITFLNLHTGVVEFKCLNLRAFALVAGDIINQYKKEKGGVH